MNAAAMIDPSETYRVRHTTMMNTARAANVAHGATARKTPNPVATPLPALNFNHTGKQCPTTANTAAAAMIQEVPASSVNHRATNTADAPFIASSASVTTPATFPALRETLVAPVPPLPVSRISAPLV